MKNYFKKFSMMFLITFVIIFCNFSNAFAVDTSQSIQINNTTLNFNKIIYVDGTNGSDETGDGSEANPVNSLPKAANLVDTDNTLVYILTSGTYAVPNGLESLLSSDYSLTYTAPSSNFGKIVIDLQKTGYITNFTMNKLNRFIGLKFLRTTESDKRTFENFYDEALINMEFDNCIFLNSEYLTDPYVYIVTGTTVGCQVTKLDYNNCSFLQHNYYEDSYIDPTFKHKSTNCAFIDSDTHPHAYNLFNAEFDSNYNITTDGWKNTGLGTNPDGSQANIGVYGGKFAWASNYSNNNSISLSNSRMNLLVGNSKQLIATTTPAGSQVIWASSESSVASVDSTGKVTAWKEGQVTITATIAGDSNLSAICIVTVTPEGTNPPTEPTNPTQPNDDANLFIELVDGNIKSYSVSDDEITKFKQWYIDRDNTTSNKPYYEFSKGTYKDFVIHDKIVWFEVR